MKPGLSNRYQEALQLAFQLHRDQFRKGSSTPYLAHLLSVSSLVLENGGDEDEAIAALLHDAVEDQGGYKTLELIKDTFGQKVADIVDGCTDAYTKPKPPWRERKETYLKKLPTANPSIQLVSLADKVHNARSILLDLKSGDNDVWEKFNGGKEGTLWYYRSLTEIFSKSNFPNLRNELHHIIKQIERLA
jgi:(p)ppGpp synthase/HD superfamily hydrolase